MLTLEPPFYQVQGTTVLRDHADPDQFYVLPSLPRLAPAAAGPADATAAGAAEFILYKYRRDLTDNPALDPSQARGAGLALFAVEIPLALGALATAVASLSGRPNAHLAAAPFLGGEVHLILAHAAGDQLIEDLVETHTAPLASPYHSAYALGLSAEGATLIEQAARGGALPVGVVYELRFLALTPALHARVTMDYSRLYDHFSAALAVTYYAQAKLDLDMSWLVEHDLIHVEIVAFTDDADRERQMQLVMGLVEARIQADFFRSGIPPEPADGAGGPLAQLLGNLLGNNVSSASALFVLKARLDVVKEEKTFTLTYDSRTAVELTHVATGILATMVAGGPPPDIREIDLDDPFFAELDVQVLSAIDWTAMADLQEAVVTLTHGDHAESYILSAADPGPYRFRAPLADPAADSYQLKVDYHFAPGVGDGPLSISAGPYAARDRALVIDPLAHMAYRRVRCELGAVEPALVAAIHLRLRAVPAAGGDDLMTAEMVLDAAHPVQVYRLRQPAGEPPLSLLARPDWLDAAGVLHRGDEAEVTGDFLPVLGPFHGSLWLVVQPAADWSKVTEVAAEVRYQDGEYLVDRNLVFTAAGKGAAQSIDFPILDPTRRTYRWNQTIIHADGSIVQSDWADADATVLVVGQEKSAAPTVRVEWVGDAGDAVALLVDFQVSTAAGNQQASAFLRAGQDTEATVTLPSDGDGRLSYHYQVRRIDAQGNQDLVREGDGHSDLLVVQAR